MMMHHKVKQLCQVIHGKIGNNEINSSAKKFSSVINGLSIIDRSFLDLVAY